MLIFFTIFALFSFFYTAWKLKKDLHILQLNSYRNNRYISWLKKNLNLVFSWQGLMPIKAKAKKRLVFTPRALRLYLFTLGILILFYVGIFNLSLSITNLIFAVFMSLSLAILSPGILILSNSFLALFEEKIINHFYINSAKKILQNMPDLTVIGITGSFGKTTTKYVLHQILRQKYNVCMTPGSFNTPMGITKVIRSELKPMHNFFIVEMSAKEKNDIAEICDLVQPKFGLLTAIGPQHLETFGSMENIVSTKNELIRSLPNSGTAFFNLDDNYCRELMRLNNGKNIGFGISAKDATYFAKDIKIDSSGSTFTVCHTDGACETFTTKLLGRHNIYNILGALTIAGELGVKLHEMIYPIRQLNAVPHRLELKKIAENIFFIDDAFNSNPVGSKMALEVLGSMEGMRKIIVTPGMIELGNEEHRLNSQFGEAIAEVCDFVILVGKKQTLPIQEGLSNKNFPKEMVYIAKDFNDAKMKLTNILRTGDVVLFENDLPDNYNE
jgi:UDP-N-acetylmuramoyl-tripeptide--D-alanyl-D-alanine ligase